MSLDKQRRHESLINRKIEEYRLMSNSITNWKSCRYGGIPGSNGHRVVAEKMTRLKVGNKTLTICEDCKIRKIASTMEGLRKK